VRLESAMAVVHSRFSTNTFPSWPLAHPYRFIAHNGEINTIKGNRNWMRAREARLRSDVIPGELYRLYPICDPVFKTYTGTPVEDRTDIDYLFLVPTSDRWAGGDRHVTCFIRSLDGSPLRHSYRASG